MTRSDLRSLFTVSTFLVLSFLSASLFAQPSQVSKETLAIFSNIRSNDLESLQKQMHSEADANVVMENHSALMSAALCGSPDAMKLLIDKGAQVNYANADGISALWLAVPDREKVELLLTHGANANQFSREGVNVLAKLAAIPGSADLMALLISKGCEVRTKSGGNDVMYNAAMSNDTAMIGLLIRHGVSVSDTSSFGDYPIVAATNYRSFNALKMLVDHGANVNVRTKGVLELMNGITPLMWAAVSNDNASFYYLLNHGADARAISPRGYTTLMIMCMNHEDDPEMAKALIDHGVDAGWKAPDKTDAMYYALLKGHTKTVDILQTHSSKK
jgi:ankyrin repeat protein